MFNMTDERSLGAPANYGFGVKLMSAPVPATTRASGCRSRCLAGQDRVRRSLQAFKGLYATPPAQNARRGDAGDKSGRANQVLTRLRRRRVPIYLFLPKSASLRSNVSTSWAPAFLLDKVNPPSGLTRFRFCSRRPRVVLPVFRPFDRRDEIRPGGPAPNAPALWRTPRDRVVEGFDRSSTIETRRRSTEHAAYRGFSFGGAVAAALLAVEPRFKVAVLSSAGLWFQRASPEVDATNFVTRVTLPTLMLNGRYDDLFPIESAQLPFFRRLGTAPGDKKHLIYEGGHGGVPHTEEVRETLDWLDKYLGPVRR